MVLGLRQDGRAWSGAAPPAVWYQFSTSRGAEHPPEHLEAYEGFAQADAYAWYNDAHRTGRVRLSGNTWPMGFEYIGSQPKMILLCQLLAYCHAFCILAAQTGGWASLTLTNIGDLKRKRSKGLR